MNIPADSHPNHIRNVLSLYPFTKEKSEAQKGR